MPPSLDTVFAPCAGCHRHVRASDARCPFCDRAQPTRTIRVLRVEAQSRAALLALSAALAAACDERTHSTATVALAMTDARSTAAIDAAIAQDASPATDAGAVFSWEGLGITGWGAAYGGSPIDPRAHDIGAPARARIVRQRAR
jgi:hypothetical protein